MRESELARQVRTDATQEIEEDERRWDAQFAESGDFLAFLAQEALDDDAAGRTEPLDPDTL